MRKHRLQDIALGMLLMALLVALAIPALAAVGGKTLDVAYMDIKLVVDGAPITPTDVNGNLVEPFAYQGTTYLPVRAVGEALGKEVTWDGNTNTVYVGEVPAGAIKTWVGVRNLVADLGTTQLGMAKNLPHIAKAIEETNAEVYPVISYLAVRPADAVTSTAIYLQRHSDDYGNGELWIAGLQGYVGDKAGAGRTGYLTIMRAMLEDIVSDSNDIDSIMNTWMTYDKLRSIFVREIYYTNQTEYSESEKAAAKETFYSMQRVYELNSVKFEIDNGGLSTLKIMPKQ